MARTLVVYFSRTGHVAKVAAEIAGSLGADLEKIESLTDFSGDAGYMKAAWEAFFRHSSPIRYSRDPADYDLVVVGSPTWTGTISSPVWSYLRANRGRMKSAAFFQSSRGPMKLALWYMERASGTKPVATLMLRQDEIDKGAYKDKLEKFLAELKR